MMQLYRYQKRFLDKYILKKEELIKCLEFFVYVIYVKQYKDQR